jgi:CyaY protein
MSTPTTDVALSDSEYHTRAYQLLAGIEQQVDRWLQDDVVDIDGARTGGLLELSLPNGSKLIINTQPPLHEIWLAARRGGFHYRWRGGQWRDTKSGEEFFATLSACASEQSGKSLVFAPPAA